MFPLPIAEEKAVTKGFGAPSDSKKWFLKTHEKGRGDKNLFATLPHFVLVLFGRLVLESFEMHDQTLLSDRQWELIQPLLPPEKKTGRRWLR